MEIGGRRLAPIECPVSKRREQKKMITDSGELVSIKARDAFLDGDLRVPDDAEGSVVVACANHHRTPQADYLARLLPQNSLATLRVDLLNLSEDGLYEDRLNLSLLSDRLAYAAGWLKGQPGLDDLPMGFFGVGTSGTSVLELAASLRNEVGAVVVWEGRPDLVSKLLRHVTAPTLLIVGGEDRLVLEHNQGIYGELRCERELLLVPGATHSFAEAGAIKALLERAGSWFSSHLPVVPSPQ